MSYEKLTSIFKGERIKALELVYDYLMNKRLNGLMYHEESDGGRIMLINPNRSDTPHVLAEISVGESLNLHIISVVISGDIASIALNDPNSLPQILQILEDIVFKYNTLAKLMIDFGSKLVDDSAEVIIKFSEFKLRR